MVKGEGVGKRGCGKRGEGVVKEVSQFKYLGSVLVTDGRLDVELNIRRGKAVGWCVWSFRLSSPLRLPHLKFFVCLFV